jgi:hypothetical protein
VDRFRQDPPTAPIPLPLPAFVPAPAAVDSSFAATRTAGYHYAGRGYGAPGDEDLYEEYDGYDEVEATWGADPYPPAPFDPRPADRIPTGTADFLLREVAPAQLAERRRDRPSGHELVSDTGRHHRRLAPAGW